MSELQCYERTHRFSHDDAQGNGDREFKVAIQREQDHEDEHGREWTNQYKLCLCFQKLAVLAAPIQPVAGRQIDRVIDCALAISHGPLQVPPFNTVLDPDVARIVFAINERCAVSLPDVSELAK